MNKRLQWAYGYIHDGGYYVGCRWEGKSNTDCWADLIERADCSNCKICGTYADPVDPVDEKIDETLDRIAERFKANDIDAFAYVSFIETIELIREVMKG